MLGLHRRGLAFGQVLSFPVGNQGPPVPSPQEEDPGWGVVIHKQKWPEEEDTAAVAAKADSANQGIGQY